MSHTRQPNILLIYTDQWRYDALGCAGNSEVHTPNLDRLASRGVRFTHCFVQHPLCMPSRLSMLSGRYPSSLGVTHMGVPVPEDAEVLPRMLGRHGYRTANLGKLHFLPHANRDHRKPHPAYGFDHTEISDEPGAYPDAYYHWVARHFPDQLPLISQVANPPASVVWRDIMQIHDGIDRPEDFDPYRTRTYTADAGTTHSAFVADRTLDYLRVRARDGNPFLCISGFYNPHCPLVAPAKYLDLYKDREITPPEFPPELQAKRLELGLTDEYLIQAKIGYYAMISEVDDHVGRILSQLDATGLADNTLVVFTSDHGEFLGEHLRWGKSYPVPDCVMRVPLLVAGAGVLHPGRCYDGIVEAVDIVPTLLSCAGLPIPPTIEGRSHADVLAADSASDTHQAALCEDTEWKALRSGDYRYLIHRDGREELFAVNEPFGEYRDVSAQPAHRSALSDMRHKLLVKLHRKERPLERTWPY